MKLSQKLSAKLSSVFAVVVLSLGLTVPAGAAVISGSVGAVSYFGDLAKPKGSFVDSYSFTLDAPSDVSGLFLAKGIKGLDYTLASGATSFSGSIKGFANTFSFSSLAAGVYDLTIEGFSKKSGGYLGLFTVAAVPEAETWAMLTVGGLLLSWQLRRRRRADDAAAAGNGFAAAA